MAGIVESVFGVSPRALQQSRYEQDRAAALEFAQLDPITRTKMGEFSTGQQLGKSMLGILGIKDQEMAQAEQTQSMQSRIDHTTPEGLMQGAAMFNQAGNPALAMKYHQAALAKQQEMASIAKTRAEEQKALAQADRARREEDMSKYQRMQNVEIGVEGRPDYRQRALYDPVTGETKNIGAPYRVSAAITAQARADQAESKLQSGQEKEQKGKEGVNKITSILRGYYSKLDGLGAIVSTKRAGAENARARALLTPAGQAAAGAVGTEAQKYLGQISTARPLLLLAIKNATGMTAKQMDSEKELQFYLKAATDPLLGYEANIEALKNLDELYGIGLQSNDKKKTVKFGDLK